MSRSQIIWNTLLHGGKEEICWKPSHCREADISWRSDGVMAVDDSWPVVASRTIFREAKSQRPDVASDPFLANIARGQQDLLLRRKSARIVSWQDLDSRCPTSVGEFQRFHLVNVFVAWQEISAYDLFAPLTSKSNTYQTEKGLTSTIPMCSSAKCTAKESM